MAILRCARCQFIKEVSNQYLGKTIVCPKCKNWAKVVNTETLVKTAVEKFTSLNQDYKALKIAYQKNQAKLKQVAERHTKLAQEKTALQAQLDQLTVIDTAELEVPTDLKQGYAFENQKHAAVLNDFKPIIQWFAKRNVDIKPNVAGSDISGYFDEMAVMLGDNLTVLADILDGIRYRQRKGYEKYTIQLNDYQKSDQTIVKQFCQMMYEYAFCAKYFWNKGKNTVFLQLSDAPQIQTFFNGEWLEWYGFMKVASFLIAKEQKFACLRSSNITSKIQDEQNELDIFFLINETQPLWIECKTGEFRDSINKYQALRKRLNIDPKYTILLVSGLDDEKAAAMSSMFKLTIVNEKTLLPYLSELLD